MRSCDRHGRNDGSLQAARYTLVVFDNEQLDEMGRPTRVLEKDFCGTDDKTGCFGDLVMWYRTSKPKVVFGPADPPITDEDRAALQRRLEEVKT